MSKKPPNASQKASAKRRARRKKEERREWGVKTREQGLEAKATRDQITLGREIERRHDLKLTFGWEDDYWYVKLLLDTFAFDPDDDFKSGYRLVNVIPKNMQIGADIGWMAQKLDRPIEQIEFMIEVLGDSGYRLEPFDKDELAAMEKEAYVETDPEDLEYERQIRAHG